MMEYFRFGIAAFFLLAGLFCFISSVAGNLRFGFVMDRMHSAGVGDTLGLLCVVLSLAAAFGFRMATLKLLLVLVFLWLGSPVTTHFLSQVEVFNNSRLTEHLRDQRAQGDRQNGPEAQTAGNAQAAETGHAAGTEAADAARSGGEDQNDAYYNGNH